jgi:exonuclease SbcC
MLKRLNIKNFQSHKDSDIKFHEGVNAIVGPSDCGKSAILRALRWVLFNDQPGEAYRRHGSKQTGVEVVIDDTDYARIRSNKDNKYTVDDEQEFDKVKNDVPEELARAFNMDDINVQKQMDAPFLLSESPAEVGRVLNRAAGIDDIDTCMSKINSMERENNGELKTRAGDLKDLDGELARYRRLPDIDARLCAAEKLDRALKKSNMQIEGIEGLLADMEAVETSIARLEPLAGVSLSKIESLHGKLKDMELKYRVVRDTVDFLGEVNAKITDLDTESLEHDIQDAIKESTQVAVIEETIKSLERDLSDLEDINDDHKDKKKLLVRLEEEFDKLMPDTCPLCQQEV